jgi:NAD(P)H-flavin reductase
MDLAARLVSEGKLDLANASILSCGPMPMLRAVAEWAKARRAVDREDAEDVSSWLPQKLILAKSAIRLRI